jgi:hypothetical protein
LYTFPFPFPFFQRYPVAVSFDQQALVPAPVACDRLAVILEALRLKLIGACPQETAALFE